MVTYSVHPARTESGWRHFFFGVRRDPKVGCVVQHLFSNRDFEHPYKVSFFNAHFRSVFVFVEI